MPAEEVLALLLVFWSSLKRHIRNAQEPRKPVRKRETVQRRRMRCTVPVGGGESNLASGTMEHPVADPIPPSPYLHFADSFGVLSLLPSSYTSLLVCLTGKGSATSFTVALATVVFNRLSRFPDRPYVLAALRYARLRLNLYVPIIRLDFPISLSLFFSRFSSSSSSFSFLSSSSSSSSHICLLSFSRSLRFSPRRLSRWDRLWVKSCTGLRRERTSFEVFRIDTEAKSPFARN